MKFAVIALSKNIPPVSNHEHLATPEGPEHLVLYWHYNVIFIGKGTNSYFIWSLKVDELFTGIILF